VAASQPNAPTGTQLNFSGLQALAANPQQLVDAMDALLMHGSMQATMKNTIVQTVTNVSSANTTLRIQTARLSHNVVVSIPGTEVRAMMESRRKFLQKTACGIGGAALLASLEKFGRDQCVRTKRSRIGL